MRPGQGIAAVANGGCTLGVDVDQNIHAFFQIIDQRLSQRTVVMIVNFSVLEKLARLYSSEKIIFGKKAIIFAVDLACARRTGGAGDGINEIGRLPKCVAQRGFTCARRGGDDK